MPVTLLGRLASRAAAALALPSGFRGRAALSVLTLAAAAGAGQPAAAEVPRAILELRSDLPAAPSELDIQQHRVASGDTLLDVLVEAGVGYSTAFQASKSLQDVYEPRGLRPSDDLSLVFEPAGGDFLGLVVTPDDEPIYAALRPQAGADDFAALSAERSLERRLAVAEGSIEVSFYQAAQQADLPGEIRGKLIQALSWSVDFHRDLRRGDDFGVLYERYVDSSGELVRRGKILYAHLDVGGEPRRLVRYEDSRGHTDFYDLDGASARRALRRSPVDTNEITSGYGMRRHPISGERGKHSGTDFATGYGAPVYAAGDGVVTMKRWWGGYGYILRVRHNETYKTAYAHLSDFADGLEKGDRVAQDEVIGYAGATGRTTGPHLHYEVLVDGERVDPMRADLPAGRNLSGQELARFRQHRDRIVQAYAQRSDSQEVQLAQSAEE